MNNRSVSQGNEYSYFIKNINLSTDKQGKRPSCQTTQAVAVQGQQKFIHHSSKWKIINRPKLSDARYIGIASTESQCLISDLVIDGPLESFSVYKRGGNV